MLEELRPSFVAPWVLVSAVVHVIFVLGTSAGLGAVTGHGVPDGDGYGGQAVEFVLEGPRDEPTHGASQERVGEAASEGVPPPELEADPVPPVVDEGEVPVEVASARPRRRPRPEAEPSEATPQPEGEEADSGRVDVGDDPEDLTQARHAEPSSPEGAGADGTLAGVPAGDVSGLILGSAGMGGPGASARAALLPSSGVCQDPVAGVWRAQKFRSGDRTWVRFILRIRREGSGLEGTITSRIWTGSRTDPRPGACTAFGMDHTWRMRARGRFEADQLSFGAAGGARLVRQDCPRGDSRYAPDDFRGRVHVMREMFEARNNDGAFDIEEPYTFRRVSCE